MVDDLDAQFGSSVTPSGGSPTKGSSRSGSSPRDLVNQFDKQFANPSNGPKAPSGFWSSLGTGLGRGVLDVTDWPAEQLAKIPDALGLTQNYSGKLKARDQMARQNFDALTQGNIPATVGRIGGNVLLSLPILGAGGRVAGAAAKGAVDLLDSSSPTAANVVRGVSNFLSGNAGSDMSGAPGLITRMASRGAQGATLGAGNALILSPGSPGGTLGEATGGAEAGSIAGALIPVAGKIVSPAVKVLSGLKGAVSDVSDSATNKGAVNLLTKALKADGLTPDQAIAMMGGMGPDSTLADVGGPNVRSLGESVANSGGPGANAAQFLSDRMDSQPERLSSALQNVTGQTGDTFGQVQNLMAQRSREAAPLYDRAFTQYEPNDVLVGSNGKPLRVFHGTAGDFSAFDNGARGGTTQSASGKGAFFFTDNPNLASNYASEFADVNPNSVIGKLHSEAERLEAIAEKTNSPQDWANAQAADQRLMDASEEDYTGGEANVRPAYLRVSNPAIHDMIGAPYDDDLFSRLISDAKSKGHDALILKNALDPAINSMVEKPTPSSVYAVFDPKNILPGYSAGPRMIQPNEQLAAILKDPIVKKGFKQGMEINRLEALAKGEPFNPSDYAGSPAKPPLSPSPSSILDSSGKPILVPETPTDGEPAIPPSMRAMDAVKKGLDDMVETYRDPVTGKLVLDSKGRALNNVRSALLDQLDSLNPDYAAARQAWAGPSHAVDLVNMGSRILSTDPAVTAKTVSALPEGDKAFFLNGVTKAIQDKIDGTQDGASAVRRIFGNSAIRSKIEAAFGDPQAYRQFADRMAAEAQYAATRNEILGGSQTARRLAGMTESGVNWAPHILNAAHGNVGGAAMGLLHEAGNYLSSPSSKQMEAVGNLLFNPDHTKVQDLFEKGSPSTFENLLVGAGKQGRKGATVGLSEDMNRRGNH